MKYPLICFLALILIIAGCRNDSEVPKVSYGKKVKNRIQPTKEDTTKIEIADLPIQFAGTNMLLFPIGQLQVSKNSKSSSVEVYGSSEATTFKISNNSDNEITGFMTNLKFQKMGQDSLVLLSNKKLFIQSVTYLKEVAQSTKVQLLVYVLEDDDTNKDGAIDQDDINTLYISTIDGKNLTKLSVNFEELIDWNLVSASNRVYFRTIEDSNKNGKFDKGDAVHYQYVNVLDKNFKVVRFKVN